jgi:hypothetical protein
MNIMNKEPERHEIEALLPWHAAGTLTRREADRVEQAIAGDRELARRFELVREELAETIHLNETLGAPSARAMEKLFAAIDAEEARGPRRQRSFDLAGRISEFLSSLAPRTLAWSATAAAALLLVQAGVITSVVMKEHGGAAGVYNVANAPRDVSAPVAQGSQTLFAQVRFAPQATVTDITNFLGAHKAKLVEGPLKGSMYRIQLSQSKPEATKVVQQMQQESRIVSLVAVEE